MFLPFPFFSIKPGSESPAQSYFFNILSFQSLTWLATELSAVVPNIENRGLLVIPSANIYWASAMC